MEPRWEADGVFLGKLDLSDEVIVGTPRRIETTRSFRRMTEDRQWNPDSLRMFVGAPWNLRGITTDAPGGIRKPYITRALVQAHGATDGCPACQGDGQVHVPRCRTRFEDIFDQEKQPGQPREAVQQDGPVHVAEQVVPGDQSCKWSENHNNNVHQSQNPVHSHRVRVTKSPCKSARHRAVREIPMTRMKWEQFVHS